MNLLHANDFVLNREQAKMILQISPEARRILKAFVTGRGVAFGFGKEKIKQRTLNLRTAILWPEFYQMPLRRK